MVLRHIHGQSAEGTGRRKVGAWISLGGICVAFGQWLTVRTHPEQDLPLWPAWVFLVIACMGLAVLVGTLVDRDRP